MIQNQPQTPLTLYTFAMSHYSEKIRWTLDCSAISYREVCLTPVFHIRPALLMGRRGQTTLPILQTPDAAIQDSPRILSWLRTHRGPLAVTPMAQQDAIRGVEKRFDAIGKDVARFLYAGSFGLADEHILKLWTDYATPFQTKLIRIGYPLIRWAFKRKLNITPAGAAKAQKRITEVIDWLEMRLARQDSPYLVGTSFTAADITAASLLAPIACPKEHPIYGDPTYQASMVKAIEPWAQRPALRWVRQMYAKHRGSFNGGVFS
jgi:glutathione S-transferase